ncbi:MAG: serine/threonine protein kinase, partial [Deltaproteobacteria bacterium]|nr:serine/threonine protein kinase [Deltaproteobacteria bacterium]
MALPPGTVMGGDYTILGPLAQGGMGSVYVAEQISTGRRRALKLMHPELARDVRSVERFAQEARVGARIGSEHVVEVVGAGIDPAHGLPWLAMEMLEGGDLASVVSSRGALPVAEVLEILEQACDAIAKAHAQGVVHRDLKPENLFIAVSHRRGVPFTVKVLDFGIAKLLSECQSAATATSTIGSPLWMAPEQADRKGKLGPPTDVWALGLITFYMLTGRMYWHAANDAEIGITALLKEVLLDEIVPASQRARDIGCAVTLPAGFDAWFARCVTRTAAERFANGAELMSAARAVLGGTAPLDASSPSSSGAAWA